MRILLLAVLLVGCERREVCGSKKEVEDLMKISCEYGRETSQKSCGDFAHDIIGDGK